jgi:hypothetical protein
MKNVTDDDQLRTVQDAYEFAESIVESVQGILL